MDWYYIVKKSNSPGYYYADANNPSMTLSPYSITNNTVGAVSLTVKSALTQSYCMFNDYPPNSGSKD